MLNLCLCVASGQDFLTFPTRQGRVLLLDFELSGGTLAKRVQLVASAMGISLGDLGDRLAIEPLRGRRMDAGGLGVYLSALPPQQFDLIVIDPLYRIFSDDMDENSNVDFARLFGHLQALAERLDAAICIVHHLSKGDQSFKVVTDLGAGGGSQARAADAHLAVRPHAEDLAVVLSGVVRSFPPFAPFCLRWKFPLFELAPDLEPADLLRPPRRTGKAKEGGPPKPTWDTGRFVADFLTTTPKSRTAILAQAVEAGVPNEHQAGKLLARAEATGKASAWKLPKDKRSYFATLPQPVLEMP